MVSTHINNRPPMSENSGSKYLPFVDEDDIPNGPQFSCGQRRAEYKQVLKDSEFLDAAVEAVEVMGSVGLGIVDGSTLAVFCERHTARLTVMPTCNIATTGECFDGPCCDTLANAKNYLAKKVMMYLIPDYYLKIVNSNHGSSYAKYGTVLCALERDSYLTVRGKSHGGSRVSGTI
ncbi:hypothetical protein KSS87_004007 [Heliosperma pusillum]|nr:hypothetical protein KSS87_004007 [Heliosperma pusillum]